MEYYNKSVEILINILKQNPNISRNEWDEYAHKNNLFSAITLISHNNINTWEDLKQILITQKIKFNYKEIKNIRKKLNESVRMTGINSVETRELSNQMDILINCYYQSIKIRNISDETLIQGYYKSYKLLKEYTKDVNKFPDAREWTVCAKRYQCLNTESIQYIAMLDWRHLEKRVKMEINFEKNFK